MEVLVFLIPVALTLGALGLVAFLWSLRSGQFDDLDGAKWRILDDNDVSAAPRPAGPDTPAGSAADKPAVNPSAPAGD